MRSFLFFSVIRFPESGFLLVAKLRGGKKTVVSGGVAYTVFKIPFTSPSPWNLNAIASYLLHHQLDDTVVWFRLFNRNEFKQMALKVAWWCDIMDRKACRCRGVGGILPLKKLKIWTSSHAICHIYKPPSKSFLLTISICYRVWKSSFRMRRGRITFLLRTRTANRTSYSFRLL